MIHTLHPLAARDLASIVEFYGSTATPKVAARFLDEFERVAKLLTHYPGFATPFGLPQRQYPLRVYPYWVVYKPVESGIRVLTVRHSRRLPSFGAGRN